jgi:PAS domain S-box-containing protein
MHVPQPSADQACAVLRFVHEIAAADTTQAVIDAVCTHAPLVLGVTGGAVYMLEGDLDTGTLVPCAVKGGTAEQRAQVLASRLSLAESGSVAAQVLRTGEPAAIADAPAASRHPLIAALGLRSMLQVPLQTPEGPRGLLILADTTRHVTFGARELALAELLGQQAALALRNVALRAAAEARAAQLAAAEARFRRLITEAPAAIFVAAADGTLTSVNAAAERLTGRTSAELAGQRWDLLIEAADAEELLEALRSGAAAQGEVTIMRRDGTTVPVVLHAVALVTSGPEAYLAIAHDLSERKQLEAQIVRAERLRTMGELAAGVAHNVNNLLSIILGHAELLRLWQQNGTLTPAALEERLAAIAQAVDDGATMVRRLHEFTRTAPSLDAVAVDVATLIYDVVSLTRPRWETMAQARGAPIELVLDIAPVAPVRGVLGELREAFVNLVLNAVDAMPHGGCLTIAAREQAGMVEIRVSDTGVGMTPEVQARIFEPFFTTKGLIGTGLGLAVGQSIITRHCGTIHVASAPGAGSHFIVSLPSAPGATPARAPAGAVATRPLRLVVIDDEAAVANVLHRLLEHDGHQVRVFTAPAAALESIAADPPDIVLSDIAMPGITGWQVAERLRGRVPVILITGWADAIDADEPSAHGVLALIRKPFRLDDVRRALALPR